MTHRVDPFDLPHAEARQILGRGAIVYLPVNPVEYHGPHLSLHNDHHVAVALARRVHDALAAPGEPFLCCADLEMGVDPACGPGTRHVPFRAVRATVVEACHRLADLGARRVVLSTFHGSPLHGHALAAGLDALRARGVAAVDPFPWVVEQAVAHDAEAAGEALDTIADPDLRARAEALLPSDFHAGFFETSMALALAPHTVSDVHTQLPDCPHGPPDAVFMAASRALTWLGRHDDAAELSFAARGRAWQTLRPQPGYTGCPAAASAAAGTIFVRHILEGYVERIPQVLDGRMESPPWPLRWLVPATLDGRVALPTTPARDMATLADLGLS